MPHPSSLVCAGRRARTELHALAAALALTLVVLPPLAAQEGRAPRRVHLGGGMALGALPGPLVGSCDSFTSGNGAAGAVAALTAGVAVGERVTIEGEGAFAAAVPFGCDAMLRTRSRPIGPDLLEVRTPAGFGFHAPGGAYGTTGARAVLASPGAWRGPRLRAAVGGGIAWPMRRPYATFGAGMAATRGRGARLTLDVEYGLVPVKRRELVQTFHSGPPPAFWTARDARTASHRELARWALLRLGGALPLGRAR